MILPRDISVFLNTVLDSIVPPIIRDSKYFLSLPMKLIYGKHTDLIQNFKNKAFTLTESQFSQVYAQTANVMKLQNITDLNPRCLEFIQSSISGSSVLEVGCGEAHLAGILSQRYSVSACDIVLSDGIKQKYPAIKFLKANVQSLPYPPASFDTVICTHTLEHVQDLHRSIQELRRVTRKRLIVVVPKQRPYNYTFNLHLHFFPYPWSITSVFGYSPNSKLYNFGDWLYVEDKPSKTSAPKTRLKK